MKNKSLFLLGLVGLNAVPLYGVFAWDWQSFDLLYLYWVENLIVGIFTLLRFVVRPYNHPVEFAIPLFVAPFFAFHYGFFCFGHGSVLLGLFGENAIGDLVDMGAFASILPIIEARNLGWAVLALALFQLMDWVRDRREHGLGGDSVKDLMTAPYRRIVVLHLTIILSGFALMNLDEPVAGLVLLVVLKTAFDIYHWFKDEKKTTDDEPAQIDEKTKAAVDRFLDNPTITVNGREIRYDNYEDFRASKHYRMMKSMVGIMGGGKKIQAMEDYVEQRWRERQAGKAVAGS